MRRESISCNEEHWEERHDACVKTRAPEDIQKEGWSILSCLDIAAVALYISFCRQSALVAEAECMHQSGIKQPLTEQS